MANVTLLPSGVAAVQKAATDGVGDLADWIVAEAQRRAPVGTAAERDRDPGEFRDSIHKVVDGATVYVVADSPHAPYVEFGTSRMRAEPTVTPAAQASLAHVDEVVGGRLAQELGS